MPQRSKTEKQWCERLREAQQESGISQTMLAKELTKRLGTTWRQSRVWKLLWCEMPITVAVYEAAAESLGLTLNDVVAPRPGAGMIVDEYDKELLQLMRHTRTTEYVDRLVTTLSTRPVEDGRATNGKRAKSA
jgi:hypothetical protein